MMLNWLVRRLLWVCFTLFGRMEISGREHVPKSGPLIIVVNHLSYNDSLALSVAIPRPLDFLGKIEFFRKRLWRFVMKHGRVHPIDRSATASTSIVQQMTKLLVGDRCLVIFAEGTRSKGPMRQAKRGAAHLALETGVCILPVAVAGTEKWSFLRALFPFCRFTVNIGIPFTLTKQPGESFQDAMDRVMRIVAALLPPGYRGVYAN